MNGTQIKCFLVMTVLAIIGFGPLSLTCLIGLYVVLARPRWFQTVTRKLYRNLSSDATDPPDGFSGTMVTRLKCTLCLLLLLVLDIAPVPVTGFIGLYVIALRPSWFKQLVERIYWDLR
jgi:hypothetical protein